MQLLDDDRKNALKALYRSPEALAHPVPYIERLVAFSQDKDVATKEDEKFFGDVYQNFLNSLTAESQDHAAIAIAMAYQYSRRVAVMDYPNIYSKASMNFVADTASHLFAMKEPASSQSAFALIEKLLVDNEGSDLNDNIDKVIDKLLQDGGLDSLQTAQKICDLKFRYREASGDTPKKGIGSFNAYAKVAAAAVKKQTPESLALATHIMNRKPMVYVADEGAYKSDYGVNQKKTKTIWEDIARGADKMRNDELFYYAHMTCLTMTDNISKEEENTLIILSDRASNVAYNKDSALFDVTINVFKVILARTSPKRISNLKKENTAHRHDKKDDDFKKRKEDFTKTADRIQDKALKDLDPVIARSIQSNTKQSLDTAYKAIHLRHRNWPHTQINVSWNEDRKIRGSYSSWREKKYTDSTFSQSKQIINLLLQHKKPESLDMAVNITRGMSSYTEIIPYRADLMQIKLSVINTCIAQGDDKSLRQGLSVLRSMKDLAHAGSLTFSNSFISSFKESLFPPSTNPEAENYAPLILNGVGAIIDKGLSLGTEAGKIIADRAAQLSYKVTKPATPERQQSLMLMKKLGLAEQTAELLFDKKFAMFQDGLKQLDVAPEQPKILPVRELKLS